MDLAGDRCILPFDFRGRPRGDIDGLELRIRDISLIFQLPQVKPPGAGEIIDIDIAVLVTGVLADGVLVRIVEQEGHAIDPGAVRR